MPKKKPTDEQREAIKKEIVNFFIEMRKKHNLDDSKLVELLLEAVREHIYENMKAISRSAKSPTKKGNKPKKEK